MTMFEPFFALFVSSIVVSAFIIIFKPLLQKKKKTESCVQFM